MMRSGMRIVCSVMFGFLLERCQKKVWILLLSLRLVSLADVSPRMARAFLDTYVTPSRCK
jgi:hypothetical protein